MKDEMLQINGSRPYRFRFASGKAEANAAGRRIGGESRPVSPLSHLCSACVSVKIASGAARTQTERLAWQAVLKLDAPLIRQAGHADSLDQECQRHVGDRILLRDLPKRAIEHGMVIFEQNADFSVFIDGRLAGCSQVDSGATHKPVSMLTRRGSYCLLERR